MAARHLRVVGAYGGSHPRMPPLKQTTGPHHPRVARGGGNAERQMHERPAPEGEPFDEGCVSGAAQSRALRASRISVRSSSSLGPEASAGKNLSLALV